MVRVNGREYSGNVINKEDGKLIVVVYTAENLGDVFKSMTGAVEVVEFDPNTDNERVYPVTFTNAAGYISSNVYSIEFSTRATFRQEVDAKLKEQSDAIDDLLIMMLEG